MTVKEVIKNRRAYRALDRVEITKEIIDDLVESAQLSASCFNYQPWNYVFVYEKDMLNKVFTTLKEGNKWAKSASMIIAVFSKKELDCIIGKSREYYLFDTGMATAYMILRGTEMGLVLHPIAGYSHSKVIEVLNIPEEMTVITLIIVGKKTTNLESLNEKQQLSENKRPARKSHKEFVFHNKYKI